MLGSAGVAVEYKIIMKYVEQLHLVLHFPPFKLWTINKLCDKFNLTKYYWMFWFYSQYIYYFQCRNSFFFISFTVSICLSNSSLSISSCVSFFSLISAQPVFEHVCGVVFISLLWNEFTSMRALHMDLFSFYYCVCKASQVFSTSGYCK